jgi:hypothetical protein
MRQNSISFRILSNAASFSGGKSLLLVSRLIGVCVLRTVTVLRAVTESSLRMDMLR